MYIVTRYVVLEVLKLFLVALAALTLMVTIGMGIKKGVLDEGLPPLIVLQTIPFLLPEMLGITIPVAMLYSVSSVFGRMTGANEIVALKSLGISPMAVVWPVLVLSAFLSLGTVWMYEVAATWCRPHFKQIVCQSIEEIAISRLRKKHSYDGDQFSIAVKRVEDRDARHILIQPTITLKPQPGKPKVNLTAAEAELHTDWKAGALKIVCRNGEVDIEGRLRVSFPDEQTYSVSLPSPAWDRYHRDWIAMRDIPERVDEIQIEIDRLEKSRLSLEKLREANKLLGVATPGGDADQLAGQIADKRRKISRLRTESYRRWSNGFTCLCFALLGTPVAMLWRHADGLTNFFVCFLPILAIYYPLLIFSEDLSTSGALPPVSFWMSNMLLAIPACVLMRWVVRH